MSGAKVRVQGSGIDTAKLPSDQMCQEFSSNEKMLQDKQQQPSSLCY